MKLPLRNAAVLQLLAVVLLVSCDADDMPTPMAGDVLSLYTDIQPRSVQRMHTGDKGNETFSVDDCISLHVMPEGSAAPASMPKRLHLTAEGWIPSLSWHDIGSNKASFTAFFPAVEQPSYGTFMHTVASDQSLSRSYANSDLLTATTRATKGQSVELTFHHRMSLVELHLSSRHTYTTEQLSKAVVKVNACRSVEVSVADAELHAAEGPAEQVVFHQSSAATYHVILPPQPILQAWRNGWIEINVEGNTYIYNAPEQLDNGDRFAELMPGKQLVIRLNLDFEQPEEDWANQTVWTHGLKDMPPTNNWGYAYDVFVNGIHNTTLGLKWNSIYGWYDCNKTNPVSNSGGDSEMCWAAAASNMLYWWLEQNKEYVDRYGYEGPKNYVNGSDCEMFGYYKKGFINTGQQVYEALDWFLTGYAITEDVKEEIDHGFFKDVLGFQKKVAAYTPVDGNTFGKTLKKAFRNKEAIECNILFGNGYLHAINIWGAKFDDKGEVSHIYITDNNDKDFETQYEQRPYLDRFITQAGILEKAVDYRNGEVFMESSTPGVFSMHIIQICTLGLMQDEWRNYFGQRE